jgi:hypothetical protein
MGWVLAAIGSALQLLNVWLAFRSEKSGIPAIPPLLIIVGLLLTDIPNPLKLTLSIAAVVVHFVIMLVPKRL